MGGRIFHHPTRPHLDELHLSRTLELAAAALGDDDPPSVRSLADPASSQIGNAWLLWQS